MKKSKSFLMTVVMVAILLLMFGSLVTSAEATKTVIVNFTPTPMSTPITPTDPPGRTPSEDEQEQLKNVIKQYFEIRYLAKSTSQQEDFKQNRFYNLIIDMSQTNIPMEAELAKLEVEIRHAELNELLYTDYKFFF